MQELFFLTLSISHGPVDPAVPSVSDTGSYVEEDKRGRKEPPNKIPQHAIEKIKQQIEKFPTQESHYCRQSTKRKYLDQNLSIAKMYELFKNECVEQKSNFIPSLSVYRQVFCKEYNLSFFKPKKDQCLICTNYEKASVEERHTLEEEYREYQKRKEESMANKAQDKKRCLSDTKFISATFDLESVLQIPCSEVSQMYYSRKLSAYNLTVYEATPPHKGYCFAWTEVNGQRGSSEIGTALLKWFQTLPITIEEISLFSDTCSGQNRNQFMAALFLFIVQAFHFKVLEHKFMEKGHSHMEVDSMHSAIESCKKHVPVYLMQDWINIFRLARSKRNRNEKSDQYVVTELRYNDFKNLKHLAQQIMQNTTRDTNNCKVKWLKIKRLRFEKERHGTILFSYDYTSEYMELKVYGKGRPRNLPTELKQLYTKNIPISTEKKKDLLKLCSSKTIPEEYHHFYQTLPTLSKTGRENPEPHAFSESDSSD